jgi:SAM-dependent methyltransferase
MNVSTQANDEQAKLWNGPAGHAWVENQELLDQLFQPFERLLLDMAGDGCSVLDVGCGTGAITLALTRQLGANAECVGIDLSEPMIAVARSRAEQEGAAARFVCADAQRHGFAPARFDRIVSRFGVMFFDRPVDAFANLRGALTEDGEMRFIAWRSAAENPFMTTAERAAAPLLPDLPVRRPDAPGQFAFADPQRIAHILEESGWAGVDIQPIDVACSFPAKDLMRYLTQLGPVGLALQQANPCTRARVADAVRIAFDRYVVGAEVRFTAACWKVDARATRA